MLDTETELVGKFRQTLRESSDRILISEFDGIFKRPDLVHARIRHLPETVEWSLLASVLRTASTARILSLLRYRQVRTSRYLERNMQTAYDVLRPSIRRLERIGIVEVEGDSVSLTYPLTYDMVDVVAYEGKLSNWRQAARQAWCYSLFSTSTRILMPESAARRAMHIEDELRKVGTGVIGFTDDEDSRIILRGRKRRPPCRMSYYQAVGKIIDCFVQRNAGHTPYVARNAAIAVPH